MYVNHRSHNEKSPRDWCDVNIRSPEIAATMALQIRPSRMWNRSNLPENMIHNIKRITNAKIWVARNRLVCDFAEGFSLAGAFLKVGWISFSKILLSSKGDKFSKIKPGFSTARNGCEKNIPIQVWLMRTESWLKFNDSALKFGVNESIDRVAGTSKEQKDFRAMSAKKRAVSGS